VHNRSQHRPAFGGFGSLSQRYTQREVGRILGVEANRLRYWERLRLVRPEARWGTRFYSFGDLVALRSIQRLTQNRIPARRLRLAVTLIEQQFGSSPVPLQELRLLERGREVLVIPPGNARPFNPLKQQWVLPFESSSQLPKLHSMIGRTPSQLFEMALDCETRLESLPQAVDIYRRVLELAPDWIDARINLGVALYQLGRIDDARVEFYSAVELDPLNGVSHYNLGCVLEEQGEIDEAIEHLQRAARAMPAHADVHFNLALAYEQSGVRRMAREEWMLYLRLAPSGPWAGQARARLKQLSSRRKHSAPIPFRRPS
jgi:Flp pilus assembly protein TadD